MDVTTISIKDGFKTEPNFTKELSANLEVAEMLLEKTGLGGGTFTIRAEDKTIDNKRVDNVVYDDSGKVVCVIEAQDCTGWLDTVHSSKIGYYCWEKECYDAILITENADENIKSYVRWMNKNTPLNIFIVVPIIVRMDKEVKIIDFQVITAPERLSTKNIRMVNGVKYPTDDNRELFETKRKEYPELFLNACKSWAHSGAMFSKYYVSIGKRGEMFYTEVIYKQRDVKNSMKNEGNLVPFLKKTFGEGFVENKFKCYIKSESFDEALKYYKPIIVAGRDRKINLNKDEQE